MPEKEFNEGLLKFLAASPTPFHAVSQMEKILEEHGFIRLAESDRWTVEKGGRYYVTRNDSSLIAFVAGKKDVVETGIRMAGGHTDSPCLRVKPDPEVVSRGCLQLGVEVYGGALLNPWFDRDLSLAGRVTYLTADDELKSALLDFARPVAVIPSLAIHLDREANSKRSINAQKDLPPILMQVAGDSSVSFRDMLLSRLDEEHPGSGAVSVLDFEMSFYDAQPPAVVGFAGEYITGARIDNLLSCYAGLCALTLCTGETSAMLVLNDHEEVGSVSTSGAQGPFLSAVLERLADGGEERLRIIDRSMMISADNAHGIHPNHGDKHDAGHGPQLNAGPVIKVNASQRYATSSETSAVFRRLCGRARVPVQSFVVRSDMACGSTIGPATAAKIGVRTLDVGVPTFAMHSIRETAGTKDGFYLSRILADFFNLERLIAS